MIKRKLSTDKNQQYAQQHSKNAFSGQITSLILGTKKKTTWTIRTRVAYRQATRKHLQVDPNVNSRAQTLDRGRA